MRTGRRLIVDFEETDLDEVAGAALEMQRHPVEMPPELRGREVEERVDRTDRAVEGTSQVKVSHVRFEHFASRSEPPARELDHPRRAVDADDLTTPIGERLEHASAAAAGFENAGGLQSRHAPIR